MTTQATVTVDLLKGKQWSPSSNMMRFYFGKDYIQVNISKGRGYYKTVGIEMNEITESAVVSQLAYFTNLECEAIFKSKF